MKIDDLGRTRKLTRPLFDVQSVLGSPAMRKFVEMNDQAARGAEK